jgi:hypothetical protein
MDDTSTFSDHTPVENRGTCIDDWVHLTLDVATCTDQLHLEDAQTSTDHLWMHNAATCTDHQMMFDQGTSPEYFQVCDPANSTDSRYMCDASVSTESYLMLNVATSTGNLIDLCDAEASTDCHHVTASTYCHMMEDEEMPIHCHLKLDAFPDMMEVGTCTEYRMQDEETSTSDLHFLYLQDAGVNTPYPHLRDAETNTHYMYVRSAHANARYPHLKDADTNTDYPCVKNAQTNTHHLHVQDAETNTHYSHVAHRNTHRLLLQDADTITRYAFMCDADTNTHYPYLCDADTNTHYPHLCDADTNTDFPMHSHQQMKEAETSTCCNQIGKDELDMYCPLMENEEIPFSCRHLQEIEKSIVFYEAHDPLSALQSCHFQMPDTSSNLRPDIADKETSTDDLEKCTEESRDFDIHKEYRRMQACINSCSEREHVCIYKELSPHCPIRVDRDHGHHFVTRTSSMPLTRRHPEVHLRRSHFIDGKLGVGALRSLIRGNELPNLESSVECKFYFRKILVSKWMRKFTGLSRICCFNQFILFCVTGTEVGFPGKEMLIVIHCSVYDC